jgi:succinate dehydrogenase hydrophobic anchor subunit
LLLLKRSWLEKLKARRSSSLLSWLLLKASAMVFASLAVFLLMAVVKSSTESARAAV